MSLREKIRVAAIHGDLTSEEAYALLGASEFVAEVLRDPGTRCGAQHAEEFVRRYGTISREVLLQN